MQREDGGSRGGHRQGDELRWPGWEGTGKRSTPPAMGGFSPSSLL